MPGKVLKYDSSRETVDVEPQLKVPLENEDGTFELEKLSNIQDVPIKWPSGSGGSCYITWPLAFGDFVELVFNDFDIGVWRSQGEVCNPGDFRMHGLSGATAWPGLRPDAQKLGSTKVHATDVVIGSAVRLGLATATQPIVLGTALQTALSNWSTAVASALSSLGNPIAVSCT